MIILNWVGIGLAIAMIIASLIFKDKIPWWVLIIWLVIVIVSKFHILKLLGVFG